MIFSKVSAVRFFLKTYFFAGILTAASLVQACHIQTTVPGHWERLKTSKECVLAKKFLKWKALEDDNASFEAITDFFHANPSWPNQVLLKRKAEQAIHEGTSKDKIRYWFRRNYPVTAAGAVAFAKVAQTEKDREIIESIFPTIDFSEKEFKIFIHVAKHLLKNKDYINRFDDRMKSEKLDAARMVLPYLPKDYKNVGIERLRLASKSHLRTKNPLEKRLNIHFPGYLWQYALYLLKTERDDDLFRMLNEKVVVAAETLDPELWWTTIRRILARRMLDKKKYKEAYDIAAHSKTTKGTEFTEAQWLKGWIDLRFLKRPKEAFHEFQILYDRAETPLNLSKAAYWAARAAEAHNNKAEMNKWLEKASKHLALFYGQLAHDMLQKPFPKKDFEISPAENKAFNDIEIVRVIRLLHKIGETEMSEPFFWKLAINITKPDEHELLIKLAAEVAGPHAAVQVTKIGAKHVMPIIKEAYPQVEKAHMPALSNEFDVNIHALIHAIIRQESRFKFQTTSRKGAKGLMQILDGTAHQVSRGAGIPYSNIYDPKSNIALGEAYLKSLLRQYKGSLILTIAAYNAGPNRVDKWVQQFGYPGEKGGVEPVEWIERIPYKETRFYVHRVLENYWLYSIIFDGIPISFWYKKLY